MFNIQKYNVDDFWELKLSQYGEMFKSKMHVKLFIPIIRCSGQLIL